MKKITLTPRELELIALIQEDNVISNAEIAEKMNVTVYTAKYYITQINKKLKTSQRRDLVRALKQDWQARLGRW